QRVEAVRLVVHDEQLGHGRPPARFGDGYAAGRRTANTAPPAGRSAARIVPPWASTIRRQMDNPRPRPDSLVLTNGSKIRSPRGGSPRPSSSTRRTTAGPPAPGSTAADNRTVPPRGRASRALNS